jgi:hypothetical protein
VTPLRTPRTPCACDAHGTKILVASACALHDNLFVHDEETSEQKAIKLLSRQLEELRQTIRSIQDVNNPKFAVWRDTTRGYLDRFLGQESHHSTRFRSTMFYSFGTGSKMFQHGCDTAEETLRAAIREIVDLGLHVEEPKPVPMGKGRAKNGGVHFNGPTNVENLAIATDHAVQKIGHMGDETGTSLKEIASLLQRSEDLTPRQVKDGLAHIEAVAVEVKKPEARRDWGALLKNSQAILALAGKATDLAQKLAPYTPAIIALVEKARHAL